MYKVLIFLKFLIDTTEVPLQWVTGICFPAIPFHFGPSVSEAGWDFGKTYQTHTKAHHNYITKIKDKERILQAAREKDTVTYKGVPLSLSADFSKETLQARRGWEEVFKVLKGKDIHSRLLYPAKLSFRMEGEIKCFPDKVKLKEIIITKPLLCEMLKGLI